MGQVRADAQGPEAQSRASPRGADARPLSPHLTIWRWHVTMAASILTRATGIALYVGALVLAGWALALASGPDAYASYKAILGSIPGKLVMFGLTVSIFYHLAAGVRHLVWDAGTGYHPKIADLTAAASIAFSVVASLAVWALAWRMGAL
ncbi:MAG: succinate dehydrogenase, cytochrome b556 subunit [Caulobacteraceae bacterium]